MTTEAQTKTSVGHCKQDEIDVYVGRGEGGEAHLLNTEIGERGWLGNPFSEGTRLAVVYQFRLEFEDRLERDEEFREAIEELHGKVLGCWCQRLEEHDPPCHAEVIAEWADRLATGRAEALATPPQRTLAGEHTGQTTFNRGQENDI